LLTHITGGHLDAEGADTGRRSYQPMNINFGLFPPLMGSTRGNRNQRMRGTEKSLAKKQALTRRALNDLDEWLGLKAAAE